MFFMYVVLYMEFLINIFGFFDSDNDRVKVIIMVISKEVKKVINGNEEYI